MKKLFIIGGMGAGKSTARKALVDEGLPYIDLDKVGHDVLGWGTVREELIDTFSADILGEDGEIDRSALAAKAFLRQRAFIAVASIPIWSAVTRSIPPFDPASPRQRFPAPTTSAISTPESSASFTRATTAATASESYPRPFAP